MNQQKRGIMKAKSIKGKTAKEIQSGLDSALADGFQPTLAITFISAEQELDSIRSMMTSHHIQIFGASSGSLFIDGDIEDEAIALLLLDVNPAYFRLELLPSDGNSKYPTAHTIGMAGKKMFGKPAFLIVSGGLVTDGDEIVAGIEDSVGRNTTLFGGLASDNLKMIKTYVFTNDKLTDNGLLALILDEEKISLSGLAYGGWQPVGNERTITSSKGNVLYTIDGEPTLDFIARYSGLKKAEIEKETAIVLASNFQLQLQRSDKHPVMRTPMFIDRSNGAIVFAGSMPEGSKIKLCLLPGFEVIDAVIKEFSQFKNAEPEADALIMFSCAGRQMALGLYVSEEIEKIRNTWGAPMAGFFCFGEIGRVSGGNSEFHNMTCSLAVLKEK